MTVREKLKGYDSKILALEKEREQAVDKAHKACKHPVDSIFEVDYYSGIIISHPPFRVCTLCGYAEEGWGCGYWKLAPKTYSGLPSINRETAHKKYVLKLWTQAQLFEFGGR